jgi:hypothetical protein
VYGLAFILGIVLKIVKESGGIHKLIILPGVQAPIQ